MTALLVLGGIVALVIGALDDERVAAVMRWIGRIDPRWRARLRERRAALPGLIDAVAAALASGLSIPQAFAEVARTLPRPLALATERAAAALALGSSIDAALGSYDDVVPSADLAPFAIVLSSFARSGGRIGRSLGRVASLVRGRLALEDERAALTAQGRMSAIVLVALAPLGGLFFAVMTPEYVAVLFGRGRWLLAVASALEIVGALWLGRILRSTTGEADLASLLDAVIVGLDAGLTFELALAALVARSPTISRAPEARRLLADLALGRGRRQAFASFASTGATEARIAALVAAATRFGSPLSDMLVTQTDVLRAGDRRRAEAQARRLPVLMLFPLAFCVLPAMLAVFLGPPLLSLLG
jgi:Flp pilus assembly protein TadB